MQLGKELTEDNEMQIVDNIVFWSISREKKGEREQIMRLRKG